MTRFLAFTVHAPLASWGDIAVGEQRGSWDMPSRSAIVGLLGAALGIHRDDDARQHELATSLGLAVRADALGGPLQDFHTAQSLSQLNMRRSGARTRAAMMAHPERVTMLSRRAYRCDALYTILLWEEKASTWSLEALQAALTSPVFTLYAGRRANVLSLPLFPEIIEAESLAAAFSAREPVPAAVLRELPALRPRMGWGRRVAHDRSTIITTGMSEASHRVVRRDQPLDRRAWLFSERVVEFNELSEAMPS